MSDRESQSRIIPTLRDGYVSHAFNSEKLEVYLFPTRFHYKNGGWLQDLKSVNKDASGFNIWMFIVPSDMVKLLNKKFPAGVKTRSGRHYATLRFKNKTDYVFFMMKYILDDFSLLQEEI